MSKALLSSGSPSGVLLGLLLLGLLNCFAITRHLLRSEERLFCSFTNNGKMLAEACSFSPSMNFWMRSRHLKSSTNSGGVTYSSTGASASTGASSPASIGLSPLRLSSSPLASSLSPSSPTASVSLVGEKIAQTW